MGNLRRLGPRRGVPDEIAMDIGLVREATARGAAVFLSSHILSEVQDVANRAGIIRDG